MTRSISWILKFTNELPNDEERIACMQANPILQTVFKFSMDPKVEWLLPEGNPPYTPAEETNLDSAFYREMRKLYLFVKGGNDDLHQIKRETIFINMLQTIKPEDAILLLQIKDKNLPYENITPTLVEKAYPGIFNG